LDPSTTSTASVPVVFGPPDRLLFGFYHSPGGERRSSLGLVLCNPLGHESMCVHRTYRHLSEQVATSGLPAIRFDYQGTGDSSGRPGDPGRVGAWIDSVRSAILELQVRGGVERVALFGVGFGATIAAIAASEEKAVVAWIAWAPAVAGHAYVRDLRAARMLESSKVPAAKRTDGSEEIMGFLFSRETLADMSAVDLLALPERVAGRVLLIGRRDGGEARLTAGELQLVERHRSQGADVRVATESGYASMMRDPYRSEVPHATLHAVVSWLHEVDSGVLEAPLSSGPASSVPASSGPTSSVPASRAPASRVLTTLPWGAGAGVSETPLFFGGTSRLFGVLTEPESSVPADRPIFCLLNVGADHHVGPHRMNVELARELASLGFLAFRLDASGLGDSPAQPGSRENVIYTKSQVKDLQSAMDMLGKTRGADRFVLVGVCSGAYLAFHTCLVDPRVVGQVLVNSFAFEWKEGDPVEPTERTTYHSTRFYRRGLKERRVWARILSGEVNIRAITAVILKRGLEQARARFVGELLSAKRRVLRRDRADNDVEAGFLSLGERGVESLMVFSFIDGGLDMIATYLGQDARRMRGKKGFSIEIVDGVDHTFRSLASQERLRQIVKAFALSRYPLPPPVMTGDGDGDNGRDDGEKSPPRSWRRALSPQPSPQSSPRPSSRPPPLKPT
jgi:pimeloyl-ACP methyl ester carboxylesterase